MRVNRRKGTLLADSMTRSRVMQQAQQGQQAAMPSQTIEEGEQQGMEGAMPSQAREEGDLLFV